MSQHYSSDHNFALFGLPLRFDLDQAQLEDAWRQVAARVHPDRFALANPVEKRVAMQWAARINEAYHGLRHPLRRARYVLSLVGVDPEVETNTAMSSAFLMQQMMWHEQLEQAEQDHDSGRLYALKQALQQTHQALYQRFVQYFDHDKAYAQAAHCVREWMFVDKLLQQVESRLVSEAS